MADYLRKNPDVFIPPIKELQIFNRIFLPSLYEWMNEHFAGILKRRVAKFPSDADIKPDLIVLMAEMLTLPFLETMPEKMKAYRRLLLGHVKGEKLFGEFSTTYCLLPENGLRHLNSAFESPKYVLMLRDPVDRYWSHLKHELRQDQSFDPAYYALIDRPNSEFLRMSDYEEILTRLWKVLGRDNVHVVFFESLFVEKDEKALKGLTDFLGIDYETPDFDTVVYPGLDLELNEYLAKTLRKRFRPQYKFLEETFDKLPEVLHV